MASVARSPMNMNTDLPCPAEPAANPVIRQLTERFQQDIELSLLEVARLSRPAGLDTVTRAHAARWARVVTGLMDEAKMQRMHRILLERINRLIESTVEAAKSAEEDHSQYPLIAATVDRLARDFRAEYWLLIFTAALDEATKELSV